MEQEAEVVKYVPKQNTFPAAVPIELTLARVSSADLPTNTFCLTFNSAEKSGTSSPGGKAKTPKLRQTGLAGIHEMMRGSNKGKHSDIYNHPSSPSKGDHWMAMPISFDKLRLTNKPGNNEHVFLESFKKYTPVVCTPSLDWSGDFCCDVRRALEPLRDVLSDSSSQLYIAPVPGQGDPFEVHKFRLDVTSFVASTAYHNKKIASLKVL
jgi:hypothetical protein